MFYLFNILTRNLKKILLYTKRETTSKYNGILKAESYSRRLLLQMDCNTYFPKKLNHIVELLNKFSGQRCHYQSKPIQLFKIP